MTEIDSNNVVKQYLEKPFTSSDIRLKKRQIRKSLLQQDNLVEKRIALLGGSTIGEIKNILELFLLKNGIKPIFHEGDYALFYEESVFENPSLEKFKPDIIYVHTSSKNITEYPHPSFEAKERERLLQETFSRFGTAWESLSQKYHCPVIINNFEQLPYRIMGNADVWHPNGRNRFINDLNYLVYDFVNRKSGIYVNDIHYLSSRFGLERWFDSANWYLYKYALSLDAIPDLCYNISLIIKSIYGKNKKSLILDLDNTLWGGVIGDDGVDNIHLGIETPKGMAYAEFQSYLKSISELGIMLNVCSKNEMDAAKSGFTHPSSILKSDDFLVFKANWEPKHSNIQAIVKELNIGIDSVVFVDDNPAERDIVRGFLSDVSVPEMTNPENYIQNLDEKGYFEVTTLSKDDLQRNETYKQNSARESAQDSFADYSEFLASLKMVNYVGKFTTSTIPRVTQLINKTNQFNFTTRRYTETEIQEISESESYVTLWGRLEDKFGDNGIVTALIARIEGKRAVIDLWVMSCRVFKRSLEYAMFNTLVSQLKKQGVEELVGLYRPTAKNVILKDFYSDLGFSRMNSKDDDFVLSLNDYNCKEIDSMEIKYE